MQCRQYRNSSLRVVMRSRLEIISSKFQHLGNASLTIEYALRHFLQRNTFVILGALQTLLELLHFNKEGALWWTLP